MNKDDFQDDPYYADFFTPTYDCYKDDEVSPSKIPDTDDIKEEHDVDTYDQYVGAHVRVPIGDVVMNIPPIRLQRIFMPSVILKADNTFLWKALSITKVMYMPLSLLICTSSMEATRK
jgi:hypothetical protein